MEERKKYGGRKKGTPNKKNPLKGYILAHSDEYFTKKIDREHVLSVLSIQLAKKGGASGTMNFFFDAIPEEGLTQFEIDQLMLSPEDRVSSELKLLNKNVPDLKSVDSTVNMNSVTLTIEDKLRELCEEEEESAI